MKYTFERCIENCIKVSTTGTILWGDIVASVNENGFPPKNWLLVRDILQLNFINEKKLKRTSNIHIEEYDILT